MPIDDLVVGGRMTVLRNHGKMPCGHERSYLKGTVLHVTAISLPYVLVEAFDPVRGKANISVDVRQHIFGRINDEYANAVIQRCVVSNDEKVLY